MNAPLAALPAPSPARRAAQLCLGPTAPLCLGSSAELLAELLGPADPGAPRLVGADAAMDVQALRSALGEWPRTRGASAPGIAWALRWADADGPGLRARLDALRAAGAQDLLALVAEPPAGLPATAARAHIERQAFAAGFRKHPAYHLCLPYEALDADAWPLVVPLQRIPDAALAAYPQDQLLAERDLHMDMLRETGERADAHLIRYQWAASLARAGDRVLDAACGLGYGSYILARHSSCASVTGIDGSAYAIDYARQNFATQDERLAFHAGYLPRDLAQLPDASFELIVSFETLEHVEEPQQTLAAFERLLAPGGRIVVSVPNDWSDETGEDPNPHHLHVYTLDRLRREFSTHFVRDRLVQQIASGCKSGLGGGQWMRMPRTWRELPAETRMPPDSEWWIMGGHKPALQPAVDLSHISYATAQRPWRREAGAAQAPIARGLVLAMHCVPASVDPRIEAFWLALAEQLASQGLRLVLLATTAIETPGLDALPIPFALTDFARWRGQPSQGIAIDEQDILDTVAWYRCSYAEAEDAQRVAHEFLGDVLDQLRPCAVLGWQSLNPVTRRLRHLGRARDIPFWSVERGWLKYTLMVDTGENNGLSEQATSLALGHAAATCAEAPAQVAALVERMRTIDSPDRYDAPAELDRAAARSAWGIGDEDWVLALFTHGEPSLHGRDQDCLADLHDCSHASLQARVDALCERVVADGHWLLVQEHPFNLAAGRVLALPAHPRILRVQQSTATVFGAADALLFTLSTLQFDAVFTGKPFGLLARSLLAPVEGVPWMREAAQAADFLGLLHDTAAWPATQQRLLQRLAHWHTQALLDLHGDALAPAARRLAAHLAQFERPLDSGFDQRVDRLLQRWGG